MNKIHNYQSKNSEGETWMYHAHFARDPQVKHLHEEEIVAKAKEVFSKYDKNKDSQVSVHELLPIMKDNLDLPELSEQQVRPRRIQPVAIG